MKTRRFAQDPNGFGIAQKYPSHCIVPYHEYSPAIGLQYTRTLTDALIQVSNETSNLAPHAHWDLSNVSHGGHDPIFQAHRCKCRSNAGSNICTSYFSQFFYALA
jgi:hypothetical protein